MTQDAEQNALLALLSEGHGGVLVTIKRDGRPQLSNVMHAYYPDERVVRVSLTDDRAKTRNLRRDPRASYHVTTPDRWAYTVAEGTAELTPVAGQPYDETAPTGRAVTLGLTLAVLAGAGWLAGMIYTLITWQL
ncbi:morphogenic membrane protein MmpA [Streptomyces sp. FW42]|uniref:morphogenic membrane protein MmpA n=1 Tax=Streptomyces sp. FW42 TaxID=3395371 RepID=UPI003A8697E0